jgi:hypothetical protein
MMKLPKMEALDIASSATRTLFGQPLQLNVTPLRSLRSVHQTPPIPPLSLGNGSRRTCQNRPAVPPLPMPTKSGRSPSPVRASLTLCPHRPRRLFSTLHRPLTPRVLSRNMTAQNRTLSYVLLSMLQSLPVALLNLLPLLVDRHTTRVSNEPWTPVVFHGAFNGRLRDWFPLDIVHGRTFPCRHSTPFGRRAYLYRISIRLSLRRCSMLVSRPMSRTSSDGRKAASGLKDGRRRFKLRCVTFSFTVTVSAASTKTNRLTWFLT